jgi:adrenodoxin-NADP+ reductase
VPFGLVRYGVAPDHSDVKVDYSNENAITKFETISKNPNVSFVGGCDVGRDISVEELRKCFHAIVFAQGSVDERGLGIPKEDNVKNVFSARNFVGWYNGDPEVNIFPDLESSDTAVVIGQGNVALDCARILLSPIDQLSKTDISQRALELLSRSRIRHVHVVGRRGPLQAAFTSKEVRELMALPNVDFKPDEFMISEIEQHTEILSKNRAKKRLMDILLKGTKNTDCTKSWQLKFLRSPKGFLIDNDGKIAGIRLEKNRLENERAIGTGNEDFLPCGLLIKSIGYLNQKLVGLPFDTKSNIVPNNAGRVLNEVSLINKNQEHILGLYCSGWIKTGPIGVLASTMYSAHETARHILDDLPMLSGEKPGLEGLNHHPSWTNYHDWEKIDAAEKEKGQMVGKPREKICSIEEMRSVLS